MSAPMDETVPIMRIGDTLLIALQGDLDDSAVVRIEDRLAQEVARVSARGVLIDVSGLTVVDSFIARVLARVVSMIRLLGAQAAVVGISPAVAITLVELGLTVQGVKTALNVERGFALISRRLQDDDIVVVETSGLEDERAVD